jgi:ABC-type transporter Mla subunit MlaD
MRRILLTCLVVAAAGAFAVLAGGAGDDGGKPRYWVEVDNAFGLIEGADFKVAGVRAGQLTDMKIDRRTYRALVQFEYETRPGLGPMRTDAFCETRPQSLIGEYFIDCDPGRAGRPLDEGDTIPVRRTASTIPADLVNNVLRLPERERLRIILNELGTGLAARGGDLNDAIRRGVPAIRETDKLLAVLARQNRVLGDLTRDADAVITALANNRENVGRFVGEARDTAEASAARQRELAATFDRLPSFLRELRPAMRELGRVADAQAPALRDLNASAAQLERFFENLGPFSEASRPALRSLADASTIGRRAMRAARPTVAELRRAAGPIPELGKNLAITLEDLYDRDRAVEPDGRSPGGKGWNGLEAILGYVFWQSQAINIFDRNGYILKVSVYDEADCSPYRDAEWWRSHPDERKHCSSALGPNLPGLNRPDVSDPPGTVGNNQIRAQQRARRDAQVLEAGRRAAGPAPSQAAAPSPPSAPERGEGGPPIDIAKTIDSLLGGAQVPLPDGVPGLDGVGRQVAPQTAEGLLDYLMSS